MIETKRGYQHLGGVINGIKGGSVLWEGLGTRGRPRLSAYSAIFKFVYSG